LREGESLTQFIEEAVDEVMAGLQGRLDDAKRRAGQRAGK
jgi:hypothetical protein